MWKPGFRFNQLQDYCIAVTKAHHIAQSSGASNKSYYFLYSCFFVCLHVTSGLLNDNNESRFKDEKCSKISICP